MDILFDALSLKKYDLGTGVKFYVNGELVRHTLGEMLWRIWSNKNWRKELRGLANSNPKNPLILERIYFFLVDYVTIHYLQQEDVSLMMNSLRELKFSIE